MMITKCWDEGNKFEVKRSNSPSRRLRAMPSSKNIPKKVGGKKQLNIFDRETKARTPWTNQEEVLNYSLPSRLFPIRYDRLPCDEVLKSNL